VAVTAKTASRVIDELWGGLAAMLVALPSAIAFGVLVYSAIAPDFAGQGALVGMIGAAALGLIAPLFGGTPALISGPCAPAAAVLAGLAAELVHKGIEPGRVPALLALTILLAGLLQVLFGLLKGGRFIKYIPYPVVAGYLSGVGVIIALGQLPKLLGLQPGIALLDGLADPASWRWPGIAVGVVTILVMVNAPRFTRKVPAAILGLFAGVVAYFAIGEFKPELMTTEANPLVIGPMQATGSFLASIEDRFGGLMHVHMADLQLIGSSALALAALLSIDTLKTCVVLDALTRRRHDSNRELLGQGIGNLAAFAVGGMAGSGQMGPTLVNVNSGGMTRRSSVIEGAFVVLAVLALGSLIAWVPIGALAGILLVIAFRMFDWSAFRLLKNHDTRLDFAVIAVVVIIAEGIGLIAASAAGVGLAILLFIRDQIRGSVLRRRASLAEMRSKTHRLQEELALLKNHGEQGGLYELQGNLFFGTTDQLFTELEPDLKVRKWVLLDMRRVQSMDYTAAHLFEQMHTRLKERGGELLFCGMPSALPSRQDINKYLASLGLVGERNGGIRVFEMRDEALEWIEDRILEGAGWVPPDRAPPLSLGQIELAREMDPAVIDELMTCVRSRSMRAGERIFSAGDEGDEVYLVRSGKVRIVLPLSGGKRHHLATFSRGNFFGEMSFLDRGRRSADAEAKTDCELFVLSRKEFDVRSRANPVLGVITFARVARDLSLRLRQMDSEFRSLEER